MFKGIEDKLDKIIEQQAEMTALMATLGTALRDGTKKDIALNVEHLDVKDPSTGALTIITVDKEAVEQAIRAWENRHVTRR